jgi:hypothetical protein
MGKEGIKQRLLAHPIVIRLLNNPNWEPARARCGSGTCRREEVPGHFLAQEFNLAKVKMAFDELTEGT